MLEETKSLLRSRKRNLLEQQGGQNHALATEIAEILIEQGEETADSSGYKWDGPLPDERLVFVGVKNGVLDISIASIKSEGRGFFTQYDLNTQELIDFEELYEDNRLSVWHVFAKRLAFLNPKYQLEVLNIYANILEMTRDVLIGLVI